MTELTLVAAEPMSTAAIHVHEDHEFDGQDFLLAPDVAARGRRLIDALDEFRFVRRARVAFLWKRKGGKAKGKDRLGSCQKPTGLLLHFANEDFVVVLSADHCRDHGLSDRQLEALIYHECCHMSAEMDDAGGMRWAVVGHDWEGFEAELERYGPWKPDAVEMRTAFAQAPLFED